jgi:hypothetical protein
MITSDPAVMRQALGEGKEVRAIIHPQRSHPIIDEQMIVDDAGKDPVGQEALKWANACYWRIGRTLEATVGCLAADLEDGEHNGKGARAELLIARLEKSVRDAQIGCSDEIAGKWEITEKQPEKQEEGSNPDYRLPTGDPLKDAANWAQDAYRCGDSISDE